MKSLTEGIYANKSFSRYGYGGPVPVTTQPIQVGPTQGPVPNPQNALFPIEVDHCADLHGWQQQVIRILNAQNEDLYVLSGAGSGKTAPVICYWVNTILQINTNQAPQTIDFQRLLRIITEPQNIPQVLWLVPIRNLGGNIEEEMTERFVSIITQILNRASAIDPVTGNLNFGQNLILNIDGIITGLGNYSRNQIAGLVRGMIQNNQVQNNQISEFKTNLATLIKDFVDHALVGRIQEGLNSTRLRPSGNIQVTGSKPFIISIYESSRNIINDLNRLRLIIFDEAQRIQGGSETDDKRAAQIGDSVHQTLFNQHGRDAQLVMLSGSTSPSTASNVIHYFNTTYRRRFNPGLYRTAKNITNPSEIRVFPMANLDDSYTQLRIIETALAGGNLRKTGIVFILFGKEKINRLVDKLAASEVGYIHPGKNLQNSGGSLYNRSDVSNIVKPGDINDIKDDRLRRAASHGLGFLYRPSEMTQEREKDTLIVQNLFRAGIIKVLFATDAVREGMNITCSEMYIPTILLPPNNREMDPGSLAQLINRAGRKKDSYATIYTDPKFVSNITRALSTDPDRFGDQPFILPGSAGTKIEAGLNYGLNIPIEAARDLGRAIARIF